MASTINASNSGFGGIVSTGDSSGQLQLQTANTTAVTIDTSQNVGIGTTSPAYKLQVLDTSATGGISLKDATYTHLFRNRGNTLDIIADTGNTGGDMRFFTNGITERMRIASNGYITVNSGNVLLGSSSVSGVLGLYEGTTGYTTYLQGIGTRAYQLTGNSGADYSLSVNNSGGGSYLLLVGYTTSNGAYKLQVNSQIFATSATIATSDARYKTNVEPISSALTLVNNLNPVSFDWKKHPIHDFPEGKTVGFLAQEVKEVLKDTEYVNNIVKTNTCTIKPEEKDEEGNVTKEAVTEEFLGIAEGNLIPLLTKAIQEQQTIINDLKARIETLESK